MNTNELKGHTQGKWELVEEYNQYNKWFVCYDEKDEEIFQTPCHKIREKRRSKINKEVVANALLLSKSPELLSENENLKAQVEELKDIGSTILAIMALERMERYDIAERLKKALLNNINTVS